jgi:ligand-binding SRPBCC domain-containing protein
MPLIYLETIINAPQKLVLDLSRSVDLHKASMTHHKEEIIDGVRSGLMHKGDTVTWKAKHLWKSRTLKVKLTELEAPHFFADEMIEGDFKKMRHEHEFKRAAEGTLMVDRFYFETPFGILGKGINLIFLKNYMARLLRERNNKIKQIAENNLAKQYLHA